jgi:hypothetical protein
MKKKSNKIKFVLVFLGALIIGYFGNQIGFPSLIPCSAPPTQSLTYQDAQELRRLRVESRAVKEDLEFLWWFCCQPDSSTMTFYDVFGRIDEE